MKSLIAGIVIIVVIGFAGFIYRNVAEHAGGPVATACTAEAKVCPDGSSVGRSGPDCAFAACAYPNVEFPSVSLAFAVPAGYAKGVQEPGADGDESMLAFYDKPNATSSDTIAVYDYPIPEGKTGNDVILANTVFEPSDMPAVDMSKFTPVIASGRTFQGVTFERFEGQIATSYYLVRASDVLRFDIIERDVPNWTDTGLSIGNLPAHKALLSMLATLETP